MINKYSKIFWLFTVFVTLSVSLIFFTSTVEATTLGINGDRFTINGQEKFLAFISYFDALDASNLSGDLDYIKAKGFNGIRIFPNWWDVSGYQITGPSGDTLMDENGTLRQNRLNDLKNVISVANSRGLVVDVSFAHETVQNLSISNYKNGVVDTINALSGYSNVIFDLQNEANASGDPNYLPESDVKDLRDRIKSSQTSVILSASVGNEASPVEGANYVNRNNLDFLAYHDSRLSSNWYDLTASRVLLAKSATSKPVFFDEPERMRSSLNASKFITAVSKAKQAGAAAWTFHNNAGFELSDSSLQSRFVSEEVSFNNQLSGALQNITWGSTTTPTPTPSTPIRPTGPPIITGVDPTNIIHGEAAEITGQNLVDVIELKSTNNLDQKYSMTGNVSADLTTMRFDIPSDVLPGTYTLTMTSPQGSATSPENITVKSGGNGFSTPPQPTIQTEGLTSFGELIALLFTWSLSLLGIVVFMKIFYAGFKWFTAAGNTGRVNEAREDIQNAVTGAIILLAAYIILYTINPDLVGGDINLPGIGESGSQTQQQ